MKQSITDAVDRFSSRKYTAFCTWAVLDTFCIGVTVLTCRWAILNKVENVGPITTLVDFAKFVTVIFAAMTTVYCGMNVVEKYLALLPGAKCPPPAEPSPANGETGK